MPDHAGGVDTEDEDCNARQTKDDDPRQLAPEFTADTLDRLPAEFQDIAPARRDRLPIDDRFGILEGAQADQHQKDGQDPDHSAADHPDHAGNEFGRNQLLWMDRKGVHEIALPPQQIFGEPLDNRHNTDHSDGNPDGKVGKHQVCPDLAAAIVPDFVPHRDPHCQRNQQPDQIQAAIGPSGRPEFILQQIFQHLNTSRKYASTLIPSFSRISSTLR